MSLDFSKIKAICFDVDGTLRDTDDIYVEKLEKFIKTFNLLSNDKDVKKLARRIVMTLDTPVNAAYTMLDGLNLDAPVMGLLEKLQDFQLRKSKPDLPMIAGTKESLELLGQIFPLSIISARGEKGTLTFLEHHKILDKFVSVASGQTTPHTKPWPDPIFWSAEKMGVPPENCLMIGDTTVDIRSGRGAKAQTVGVLSGFGDQKELSRVGANLVIKDVAYLTRMIQDHLL